MNPKKILKEITLKQLKKNASIIYLARIEHLYKINQNDKIRDDDGFESGKDGFLFEFLNGEKKFFQTFDDTANYTLKLSVYSNNTWSDKNTTINIWKLDKNILDPFNFFSLKKISGFTFYTEEAKLGIPKNFKFKLTPFNSYKEFLGDYCDNNNNIRKLLDIRGSFLSKERLDLDLGGGFFKNNNNLTEVNFNDQQSDRDSEKIKLWNDFIMKDFLDIPEPYSEKKENIGYPRDPIGFGPKDGYHSGDFFKVCHNVCKNENGDLYELGYVNLDPDNDRNIVIQYGPLYSNVFRYYLEAKDTWGKSFDHLMKLHNLLIEVEVFRNDGVSEQEVLAFYADQIQHQTAKKSGVSAGEDYQYMITKKSAELKYSGSYLKLTIKCPGFINNYLREEHEFYNYEKTPKYKLLNFLGLDTSEPNWKKNLKKTTKNKSEEWEGDTYADPNGPWKSFYDLIIKKEDENYFISDMTSNFYPLKSINGMDISKTPYQSNIPWVNTNYAGGERRFYIPTLLYEPYKIEQTHWNNIPNDSSWYDKYDTFGNRIRDAPNNGGILFKHVNQDTYYSTYKNKSDKSYIKSIHGSKIGSNARDYYYEIKMNDYMTNEPGNSREAAKNNFEDIHNTLINIYNEGQGMSDGTKSITKRKYFRYWANKVGFDVLEFGIGPNTFENCKNLKKATIISAQASRLGNSCFKNCVKLEEINLGPETKLSINCFENCQSLRHLKVDVADYPGSVLKNCKNLVDINLTKAETFGDKCFEGCINLKEIKIYGKLNFVHETAFKDCENLKKFIFFEPTNNNFYRPDGLQILEDINEIEINISSNNFDDMSTLINLVLTNSKKNIKRVKINTQLDLVELNFNKKNNEDWKNLVFINDNKVSFYRPSIYDEESGKIYTKDYLLSKYIDLKLLPNDWLKDLGEINLENVKTFGLNPNNSQFRRKLPKGYKEYEYPEKKFVILGPGVDLTDLIADISIKSSTSKSVQKVEDINFKNVNFTNTKIDFYLNNVNTFDIKYFAPPTFGNDYYSYEINGKKMIIGDGTILDGANFENYDLSYIKMFNKVDLSNVTFNNTITFFPAENLMGKETNFDKCIFDSSFSNPIKFEASSLHPLGFTLKSRPYYLVIGPGVNILDVDLRNKDPFENCCLENVNLSKALFNKNTFKNFTYNEDTKFPFYIEPDEEDGKNILKYIDVEFDIELVENYYQENAEDFVDPLFNIIFNDVSYNVEKIEIPVQNLVLIEYLIPFKAENETNLDYNLNANLLNSQLDFIVTKENDTKFEYTVKNKNKKNNKKSKKRNIIQELKLYKYEQKYNKDRLLQEVKLHFSEKIEALSGNKIYITVGGKTTTTEIKDGKYGHDIILKLNLQKYNQEVVISTSENPFKYALLEKKWKGLDPENAIKFTTLNSNAETTKNSLIETKEAGNNYNTSTEDNFFSIITKIQN